MKLAAIALAIFVGLLVILARPRLSAEPESTAEIEKYIHQLISRNSPPGLSVSVVKGGRVVYQKAFGLANGPEQLPTTPDTVYHWWSMTKIPTAIAILQLQDAKKLDIDDPVSNYLSFFQVQFSEAPGPPITIRQLLRHTSGLPDVMPAMIGWVHYENKIYNQSELVQKHLRQYNKLRFTPDSKVAYSNLGYMLLGAIIETVSGQSYEDYLQEHILAPLGMINTGFLYTPQMSGKIAAGSHPMVSFYTPLLPFLLDMKPLIKERDGTQYWFNPFYIDVTPSTGLIGSANEVGLLIQALLTQSEILSPESHYLLQPKGISPDERPLGWAEYNPHGRPWVQHSGGGPGFATIMRLYPEEGLGIVIMANNTNLPREELVDAFAGLDW